MKQSETIKTLSESLVKAQSEFVTLPKNVQGYGYKYTDLDTVVMSIKPILAKYNLAFLQGLTMLENGKIGITTRVFNSIGEYIEDTVALPDVELAKGNSAQKVGAAITYMKRYALCAMLGISNDEDTDATTTQQPKVAPQQARNIPPKPIQPKAPAKPKLEQPIYPYGGSDTPEEKKEINRILTLTYNDGSKIFNSKDFETVAELRRKMTAKEVIEWLYTETDKRNSAKADLAEGQEEILF